MGECLRQAIMQSELFFFGVFSPHHPFLQEDQGIYHSKVRDMISDNQYRLLVSINDLRRKNEKRANRLVWGTGVRLWHLALGGISEVQPWFCRSFGTRTGQTLSCAAGGPALSPPTTPIPSKLARD